MPNHTQADRPVRITTPLGCDALLLVGWSGAEGVSRLFEFRAEVLADNRTDVPFDKLLGQKIAVEFTLPGGKSRHFNGICKAVSQGERDTHFTAYQLEIVPQMWLLSKRVQSRIFQHQSVPDILKKILASFDPAFELQGNFPPRNYCVQYRESDLAFVSRLMEEEGIYYFFKHSADGHKLVVANSPPSHPPIAGQSKLTFEKIVGDKPKDNRVFSWRRAQEIRSGKVTLWDHHFQLPGKHLEANQSIKNGFQAGTLHHPVKVANNDQLEVYDYPGGYANRFDGIQRGGGEQPAELQKIFDENKRVTNLRMEQETALGLTAVGTSTCGNLAAGHRFTLEKHFNADGDYLLTKIEHECAIAATYRSGDSEGFSYKNTFHCIPAAVPFRPPLATPRPVMRGTQTAVVVGPSGEEIFTDKYGRVKVQFPWDREGKYDADSSCWIRVATTWAGKQWGAIHIPRIGQEVVVDFLEGNPDQPIIVGSVYNADQMPPSQLPDNRMVSGVKTCTYKGKGYNELSMDDSKGKEKITLHAQYDMASEVEHDNTLHVKNDQTIDVDGKQTTTVKKDIVIKSTETSIEITAATELKLVVGNSKIVLKKDGTIEIAGLNVVISGTQSVAIN